MKTFKVFLVFLKILKIPKETNWYNIPLYIYREWYFFAQNLKPPFKLHSNKYIHFTGIFKW
jgi:hypothetical protein